MNQNSHHEIHLIKRTGWLRAAVLGANDGIISVSSLIVGVASASTTKNGILVAAVAGLVAGAMSMAAGEYVSVSSQADTESSDLAREQRELNENPEAELNELTQIYMDRGVSAVLAREVATQLMQKDALGAHAREELGISELTTARPVQAAFASAIAFTLGAVLPFLAAVACPETMLIHAVTLASLISLALLGAVGAKIGGANMFKAVIRVTFWGAFAMAITASIGLLYGAR